MSEKEFNDIPSIQAEQKRLQQTIEDATQQQTVLSARLRTLVAELLGDDYEIQEKKNTPAAAGPAVTVDEIVAAVKSLPKTDRHPAGEGNKAAIRKAVDPAIEPASTSFEVAWKAAITGPLVAVDGTVGAGTRYKAA